MTGGPDNARERIGTSRRDRGTSYWYLIEAVRLWRSDPCFARDKAPGPAGILSTRVLLWLDQASLLGLLAKIKV